jgi:hypothetical protein
VFVGADDLPIHHVNQFLAVVDRPGGSIFLTVGSLQPPPIAGETLEERKAQAESIPFVPVKPVARLAMTPQGLHRLIEILQETVRNYEGQAEEQSE